MESDIYVYADDFTHAQECVEEDLDEIVEAYGSWDIDDFGSEEAEISSISAVDKLPKRHSIPEALDFRTQDTEPESDPEPVDPRQTKLPI